MADLTSAYEAILKAHHVFDNELLKFLHSKGLTNDHVNERIIPYPGIMVDFQAILPFLDEFKAFYELKYLDLEDEYAKLGVIKAEVVNVGKLTAKKATPEAYNGSKPSYGTDSKIIPGESL